jgi:hypothetical protein
MNDTQSCCAHCKVSSRFIDYADGTRSEYWECDSKCGTHFLPVGNLEKIKNAESYRFVPPAFFGGFCLGAFFISIIILIIGKIHL